MGEHKHNPTTIAAKNGELPPKKPKMSKRQTERLMMAKIMEKVRPDPNMAYFTRDYFS